MKKTILSLALCISAIAGNAQTTVKGILVDESKGEGEPYATIRVIKEGAQTPTASFLTDASGRFSQPVKGNGKFNIVISSVGKENLSRPIQLTGTGTLNLDTLYIKESTTALGSVEVVAQKPLVKMEVDKMTYNVAEDEDSKASTVLDMLRKVPMVIVDGQDNITVNGSSSFKVYVDGKPNVMFNSNASMIFKNMPAAAVKSIEVVTNPGAKYDAEGAGGVLNFVLNRDLMGGGNAGGGAAMNGYNGTLRGQVGNTGWGAGIFLNGQQGKLSYNATVVENYMKPGTPKVDTEMEQMGMTQTSMTRAKTKLPFTMASLALGYDIDSIRTLGFSAEVTNMTMKNTGHTSTGLLAGNTNNFTYGSDINMKNRQTSFSGSLDYQRFFNADRTSWFAIAYQLNYTPNRNKTITDFEAVENLPIDITDRTSDNDENTTEHTLQADYTTPLGTPSETVSNTLNLGAKLMMRKAESDAKYFLGDIYNEDLSMDYEHRNKIGAAYAEYEGKWNQFGAKAGLRYEHTWQDIEYHLGQTDDFSTDYGNLVPSASLSYSMAPTVNLGLTYNMRISRPGITYLNPYVDRSSPTALTYGNSNLDVEKTHNLALVFNAFSTKLMMNLNLSHNFTDNGIEQYSFDDGEYLHTTYGNIVKRHRTALNGYASLLVHKNTRLFFNGGVGYVDLRSNQLNSKNSGWEGNILVGVQQTLPWNLKLSTYFINQSKKYTLQGYSGGMNLLIGTLTKNLFNDKLTLGLQGLTGIGNGGCLKIETMSRGEGFVNHSTIRVPIYGVTFTVTYAFGNTKKQFKQHQSRIENSFIEQKSQGEMIQGAGNITQ